MPSARLPILLAALSLLARPLAAAEPRIVESVTPQQVVKYLAECELPDATIDKDGDVIVKMHGTPVLLLVASTKHTVIQFKCGLTDTKATLLMVNEWNLKKRFTKAYIDADGDPNIEMDLDLEGGVTEARLRDAIKTFHQSVRAFIDAIQSLKP
jgi:hypothetical protein